MKKLMFTLAAAAALTVSADVKLATVEMLTLVRNHPNYESNKSLLTSTEKDYSKKLEAIKGEGETLQTEGKKQAEQLRNPMLAAKAKAEIEKSLTEIQTKLFAIEQRYRSEAARSRQDLQDLETRLLKATTSDLRKRIAKYAEENGFDMIIDVTAAIPYAKKSFDCTDEILKKMGVDPKEAKRENEGK